MILSFWNFFEIGECTHAHGNVKSALLTSRVKNLTIFGYTIISCHSRNGSPHMLFTVRFISLANRKCISVYRLESMIIDKVTICSI